MNDVVPQYPFEEGDHLFASALNAAIANGPYMAASIVNVTALGAHGDGVTDDTAAIQATLNGYAGKGTVFIPDTGHSYIVGALTVPTGTDLLIHGTLFAKAGTGTLFYIQNASNVTVRGHGTIDCNGAHATFPQAGVYVFQSNNVAVSGFTIKNSLNWNLNVVASSHVRIDGVTMLNCGNSNEFAQGSDDCWVTGCLIDGVNDLGFAFYGGVTNSGAIGNVIRNIGGPSSATPLNGLGLLSDAAGGQSAPCSNIVLADNIIHHCTGGGIYCDTFSGSSSPHTGITVSGNICHDNGLGVGTSATLSDIGFNNCENVTVIGNRSARMGSSLISAQGLYAGTGCRGVSFIGNHIFDVGQGTTTGVGLHVNFINLLMASSNYFYSSPDNPGGVTMQYSINGSAGLRNAFISNYCDRPVSLVTQPDTTFSNAISGLWSIGAGTAATDSILNINAQGSHSAIVEYQTGGVKRWVAGTEGTPETGGNAGSNYAIFCYNDAGTTQISRPLEIDRPSGIVIFAVAPRMTALPTNFANDAAAATGGLPVGAIYRNGSVLQIRVT